MPHRSRAPSRTARTFESHKSKKVILREAAMADTEPLRRFYNRVVAEDTFILVTRKVNSADERKWLARQLERVRRKETVYIVAECDGRIVAAGDIVRRIGRSSHTGELGLIVARTHRNRGLGSALICRLLVRARRIGIGLVTLHVFSNNRRALHVYEKAGFVACGRIPRLIRYRGRYVDSTVMYKFL